MGGLSFLIVGGHDRMVAVGEVLEKQMLKLYKIERETAETVIYRCSHGCLLEFKTLL